MDKQQLKTLQESFTTMEHNKKTGKDEPVLHITWEYMQKLHNYKNDPVEKTEKQKAKAFDEMQEKENNEIVLAYYKKERHGKKVRNVPISCPRRLVESIQKEALEKYGKDFIFPPSLKKKEEDAST